MPSTPLYEGSFEDSFIAPDPEYKNPPINTGLLRGTNSSAYTSSNAFGAGAGSRSARDGSIHNSANSRKEFTPLLHTVRKTSQPIGSRNSSQRSRNNENHPDETPIPSTSKRGPPANHSDDDSPGLLSYDELGSLESIGSVEMPSKPIPSMFKTQQAQSNNQQHQNFQSIPLKRQEELIAAQQDENYRLKCNIVFLEKEIEKLVNDGDDVRNTGIRRDITKENIELKTKMATLQKLHLLAMEEKNEEILRLKKIVEENDEGSISTAKDDQKENEVIQSLEKKVQEYEEEIEHLEDELSGVKAQLEEEEREAEDYRVKYLELKETQDHEGDESRIQTEKVEELQAQIDTFVVRLEEKEEEIEGLEAQIEDLRAQKSPTVIDKEMIDKEIDKITEKFNQKFIDQKEHLQKFKQHIKQMEKDHETAQNQSQATLSRTQADLSRTQLELKQAQAELKHAKGELNHTQADLNHTQTDWKQIQNDMKRLQTDLQQAQEHLQRSKQAASHYSHLVQQRDKTLEEKTAELKQLEAENSALLKELKQSKNGSSSLVLDLKKEINKLKSQIASYKDEISNEQEKNAKVTKNYEMLKTEIAVVRGMYEDSDAKLLKQEELVNELQLELNNTKQKLNAAISDGASASEHLRHQQEQFQRERNQTYTSGFDERNRRFNEMYQQIKQLEVNLADNRGIQEALQMRIADLQNDLSLKQQTISKMKKAALEASASNHVLHEKDVLINDLQLKVQKLVSELEATIIEKKDNFEAMTELVESLILEITSIESLMSKEWSIKNFPLPPNSFSGPPLRKTASYNSNYQRRLAQLQEDLAENERRGNDLLSTVSVESDQTTKLNSVLGKLRLQIGAKAQEFLSLGEGDEHHVHELEQKLVELQHQRQDELEAAQRENLANQTKLDDMQDIVNKKLDQQSIQMQQHLMEIENLQDRLKVTMNAYNDLKAFCDKANFNLELLQNNTGQPSAFNKDNNTHSFQEYLKNELQETKFKLKSAKSELQETRLELQRYHDEVFDMQGKLQQYKSREQGYKNEISELVERLNRDRENDAVLYAQKLKESKQDIKSRFSQKYGSEVEQLRNQLEQQYKMEKTWKEREEYFTKLATTLSKKVKYLRARNSLESRTFSDIDYMRKHLKLRLKSYNLNALEVDAVVKRNGFPEGVLNKPEPWNNPELEKLRAEFNSNVYFVHHPLGHDPRENREKWNRYRALVVEEGRRKIRVAALAAMAINRLKLRAKETREVKDNFTDLQTMVREVKELERRQGTAGVVES